MLKNDYLLAKIGVDTAENEPLQNWEKMNNYSIDSLVDTFPQPLRQFSLILSLRPYRGVSRLRLPPCSQQEAKIGSRHKATRLKSCEGIICSLLTNFARDKSMHVHVA